jgi:pimeloyl-ACP methyl ester carboxylesterase
VGRELFAELHLIAALLIAAASCADPEVTRGTGVPAPRHPEAVPIVQNPPAACSLSADSLTTADDWRGTGLEVGELVPDGWDPRRHPTLIFLHGDNTAPDQYHCYRELLAPCCVRSIYPRQPNSAAGGIDALGWYHRYLRWSNLRLVYDLVTAEQDAELVFIGGHSIGAYTAMLAAGANSWILKEQAGNCTPRRCRPLPAAGYISISGWPARSRRARQPFWFSRKAFEQLEPNRYVAYGTHDTSTTGDCFYSTPPLCRGDAFEVDRKRADELNLRLDVLEKFEHSHFMCNENWRESHRYPQGIRDFVDRLGDWIAATAAEGDPETARLDKPGPSH